MRRVLIISSFIIIFSTIMLFSILNGRILWGIKVNGVNLGGLTFLEAKKKLLPYTNLLQNRTIYLTYKNKRRSLNPDLINMKVDINQTLQDALNIGRSGKLSFRLKDMYYVLFKGKNLYFRVNVDDKKVQRVLNTIDKEIHIPPQNATLITDGQYVKVKGKSRNGEELSIEKTKKELIHILENGGNEVPLILSQSMPSLSEDIISKIGKVRVLASFSTNFNPAQKERSRNVEIAADVIKGYVIKPYKTFSFNEVVGPTSEEEGYKKAMVIIDNKFVPDWGGGVCQVSTTLYNAALMADLKILKRKEHSRPVKYIPPGRGSTVAYGLIDLTIQNPFPKPVIIWTKIEEGKLTVYLVGDYINGKEIIIESTDYKELYPKNIIEESNQLSNGKKVVEEEGAKGYQVTTWRIVKQNGKTIRRELIAQDHVEAINRKIKVGTKK